MSQHKSTGRSWSRARTGEVEGVCRCWLCVGEQGGREPRVSACPGPLAPCSSSISSEGGSGCGLGAEGGVSGANWPQREGGDRSLESAGENWRSPLGTPLLLASGRPCPACHPPWPAEMHPGTREEQARRPGRLVWFSSSRDSSCHSTTPVLPVLPGPRPAMRSSVGGTAERAGQGSAARGGAGGGRGRARARARGRAAGRSQVLAALQLVGFLSVGGGRHADVHHVVAGGLIVGCAVCDLLL